MIDPDLLDEFSNEEQHQIKGAIMTLASSGILLAQKERLFRRIAEGSDTQAVDDIASSILAYRKDSHGLVQLHQQGEEYLQELKK